jgi:hypothetical protein
MESVLRVARFPNTAIGVTKFMHFQMKPSGILFQSSSMFLQGGRRMWKLGLKVRVTRYNASGSGNLVYGVGVGG